MNNILSPLHSFPDLDHPKPELFGAKLTQPDVETIVCYCTRETAEGAEIYGRVLGVHQKMRIVIVEGRLPCDHVNDEHDQTTVPIFIDAVDSSTKDRFFENPNAVSFADHNYVPPKDGHSSVDLQTVGTSSAALSILDAVECEEDLGSLIAQRSQRLKEVLGEEVFTYNDLRELLRSPSITKVVIHALGPVGTNIHQVAEEYAALHDLHEKTEIVVHPKGVEPMQYAEIAKQNFEQGVLHLHIRCAVYYQERDLYDSRPDEQVFADHHYMHLDEMQVASQSDNLEEIGNGQPLVLASHPSPLGLIRPWLDGGQAKHVHASSNSVAAQMVADGEADLCMTTESSRQLHGLQKNHSSGSPTMMFTLGTPHHPAMLRQLLSQSLDE